jgi:hypothetical protein
MVWRACHNVSVHEIVATPVIPFADPVETLRSDLKSLKSRAEELEALNAPALPIMSVILGFDVSQLC